MATFHVTDIIANDEGNCKEMRYICDPGRNYQ